MLLTRLTHFCPPAESLQKLYHQFRMSFGLAPGPQQTSHPGHSKWLQAVLSIGSLIKSLQEMDVLPRLHDITDDNGGREKGN